MTEIFRTDQATISIKNSVKQKNFQSASLLARANANTYQTFVNTPFFLCHKTKDGTVRPGHETSFCSTHQAI